MKKFTTILFCIFCFSLNLFSQKPDDVFEKPATPVLFGKDIISDGLINRDMALSADNNEMYYTIQHKNGSYSVIMHCTRKGNKWSVPEVAWFSGQYNDLEAAFSPDGKRIFFSSNRPLPGGSEKKDYDIWYIEKKGNGWTEPVNAGPVINTAEDEFYPSLAKNSNLYFTRNNGSTKEDILVATPINGTYRDSAIALPATVNSPGYDFNAFVDPAETFIIFTSYKRKDDTGGGDLYISSKANGEWTEAVNMGKAINSTSIDYCPFVSPDQKYFFFTSSRTILKFPFTQKKKAAEIRQMLLSAGNGNDDIYYVSFDLIRKIIGAR